MCCDCTKEFTCLLGRCFLLWKYLTEYLLLGRIDPYCFVFIIYVDEEIDMLILCH